VFSGCDSYLSLILPCFANYPLGRLPPYSQTCLSTQGLILLVFPHRRHSQTFSNEPAGRSPDVQMINWNVPFFNGDAPMPQVGRKPDFPLLLLSFKSLPFLISSFPQQTAVLLRLEGNAQPRIALGLRFVIFFLVLVFLLWSFTP